MLFIPIAILSVSACIQLLGQSVSAASPVIPTVMYERSIEIEAENLAVSPTTGNIYVVGRDAISIFDKDYNLLSSFGSIGTGDGQFNRPLGIAIDKQGNVYIGDNRDNRIQKFTPNGDFILKFGSSGTGDGQFTFAEGLGIDSNGYLYVADGTNGRIQKFNSNGEFVSKFGTNGTGNNELSYVESLAINSKDEIYVTDGNNYVQKYDSDGNHLAQLDGIGTAGGAFGYAEGLAIDEHDNVYVIDFQDKVHIFNKDNTYLTTFGEPGSGEGQFSSPYYSTHANQKLYVTDLGNDRIQVFTTHQSTPVDMSSATVNGKSLLGKPYIKKIPTFTGQAPAGSTVKVTVHSDPVICTTVAASDGSWSCTLPEALPAGLHTVRVLVTTTDSQTYLLGPYTVRVAGSTIAGNIPGAPDTGIKPADIVYQNATLVLLLTSLAFILFARLTRSPR